MALPTLDATQRCRIGGGADAGPESSAASRSNATIGLLGSGTGLGVSGLVSAGGRWVALQSEGGHASFAPSDEREDFILSYARKQWPHVSCERVASGSGIALIYAALAARAAIPHPPAQTLDVSAVVERALAGDALGYEALDCFCGILGACAGNLAVTLGATGGVYVGGGVVLRFRDFFLQSSFRQRFEAKGRFEPYLKQIPTYLITAEQPALPGVAALLAERLDPNPNFCVSAS
jgi:glucokinase